MAQKVTVVLEDDLTGGPAGQTIRFAFEGTSYEIGLNPRTPPRSAKSSPPTLRTPAGPAGRRPAMQGGRRPAASARVISGRGRKSTAWRSAGAGASPPAWWTSTARPAAASHQPAWHPNRATHPGSATVAVLA